MNPTTILGLWTDGRPYADELARGSCYKHEHAKRQIPIAKPEELLSSEGWYRNEVIGSFIKSEINAIQLSMPVTGCSGRRVVRDSNTGQLIDDLFFNAHTSNRRFQRQLKVPTNIESIITIDEVHDDDVEKRAQEMTPKEASMFRGIVARVNFLAQDRSDLQFASKECSRRMSVPRVDDWGMIKRIGRYLVGEAASSPDL